MVTVGTHCLLEDGREKWQSGEENKKRGGDWLAQIYRHNDVG